ncbi:metal-dependent hydrolase [Fodinisporobacter ferrooxydans]|uniref:Metal-dependent hydrolase n=1 Tax=Fodinisporobacter ferrooxydans TaxID=2901836 RepID=A0ABY4CFA8_9BACL|nr:metal-dependent hydrolase [Alicyclobacillaceae bacterium MYW30-H2]
MDTASHVLFGCTIAGLAYVDPQVSHNPILAQAVLFSTVIGSNLPDVDSLVRLKGYSSYIRHHRGITHSIPALLICPLLVTWLASMIYHLTEFWYVLYGWTFLSVVFHVFLDMLNTYGVQCYYPFTKKWIHYDILAIFEPFLFFLHTAGLIGWIFYHLTPNLVFLCVYLGTIGYIGIRTLQHNRLARNLQEYFEEPGICHVLPTFHWFRWQYVFESDSHFKTGTIYFRTITHETNYPIEDTNPVIQATLRIDGVRAFLGFAQMIHVTCKEHQDGYEVCWSDVRFWYNRKLPFGVDVRLDKNLNVLHHSFGWRKKAWDPPFV